MQIYYLLRVSLFEPGKVLFLMLRKSKARILAPKTAGGAPFRSSDHGAMKDSGIPRRPELTGPFAIAAYRSGYVFAVVTAVLGLAGLLGESCRTRVARSAVRRLAAASFSYSVALIAVGLALSATAVPIGVPVGGHWNGRGIRECGRAAGRCCPSCATSCRSPRPCPSCGGPPVVSARRRKMRQWGSPASSLLVLRRRCSSRVAPASRRPRWICWAPARRCRYSCRVS